ncbi:MAG: uroporphyrinogen-III synthase [Caldimonas sp.]
MRVIVTRPAAQAHGWVQDLQARGFDAVALPLISIAAAPDPAAVRAAWATLAERRLVVFVSPNAATAFFAAASPGARWPASTRAASPGPGTTGTLIGLGVPAAQIDAPADDAPQFDSEALWARLERDDWRDAPVLVVRGERGRDWLAARLAERGAHIDEIAAYARAAPTFDASEWRLLEAALAAPQRHLWLFSSSEAIENLGALARRRGASDERADIGIDADRAPAAPDRPGRAPARVADWRDARAVATHPRIAARARELGFGAVHEARPTPAAVAACIQSIRP